MADLGTAEGIINTLPLDLRAPMKQLAMLFLRDLRMGHPSGDARDPALNFGAAFLHGVTPSTPGEAFSLAHAFGRTPYLALGVLRLDTVGSMLVPVTVQRAADDKRIYLTSTEADAPVSLLVEG